MSTKKSTLDDFKKNLKPLLAPVGPAPVAVATQKPKIQKVPAVLRGQEGLKKYFEPRFMSFGPIHYGNYKLGDTYKLELVVKFLRDGKYSSDEELYNEIKPHIVRLRERFDGTVIPEGEYDEETLNGILFFDGCAILQYIKSYFMANQLIQDFKIKNDQVALINHDLFLLENQIPYRVLELLMDAIERKEPDGGSRLQSSLNKFISSNVMAPQQNRSQFKAESEKNIDHLLDLLLRARTKHPAGNGTGGQSRAGSRRESNLPSTVSYPDHQYQNGNKEIKRQSFRSVQDLRAAGIDVKRSSTCSLWDVHFYPVEFGGKLVLPPLIVDDAMAAKFMNLIAYEMCPDNIQTKYEVTSYICFLDSLIDYPADVKELRKAGVLHNLLGSDKEVAMLFNNITTDLVPNPKVYEKVINDIEEHYKNQWMTWIAQVYNDHFSTPWTIVAFIAAIVALLMSGIQTWFTVNPAPGPCDNFCHNQNW